MGNPAPNGSRRALGRDRRGRGGGLAAVCLQRAPRSARGGHLHQRPGRPALLDRLASERRRPRAEGRRVRLPDRAPGGGRRGRRGHQRPASRRLQRPPGGDRRAHRAGRAGRPRSAAPPAPGGRRFAGRPALSGRLLPRPERLQGDGDGPARARLRGGASEHLHGKRARRRAPDRRSPAPGDARGAGPLRGRERLRVQPSRPGVVRGRRPDLAGARARHREAAHRRPQAARRGPPPPQGDRRRGGGRGRRGGALRRPALRLRGQGRRGPGVRRPARLAGLSGRGPGDLAGGRFPGRPRRGRGRLRGGGAGAPGGRDRRPGGGPSPRLRPRGRGGRGGAGVRGGAAVRVDLRGGQGAGGDRAPGGGRGTRCAAGPAAARDHPDDPPLRARCDRRRRAGGLDLPGASRRAGRLRPAGRRAGGARGPGPGAHGRLPGGGPLRRLLASRHADAKPGRLRAGGGQGPSGEGLAAGSGDGPRHARAASAWTISTTRSPPRPPTRAPPRRTSRRSSGRPPTCSGGAPGIPPRCG